jgi:HD-GYP domain-containing protein (c-di-GMP phosphodiesterase class II)
MIQLIGILHGGRGDGFTQEQLANAGDIFSPLVEMAMSDLELHLPAHLKGLADSSASAMTAIVTEIAQSSEGFTLMLRLFCSHDYLVRHSFLVAILSMVTVSELDYTREERKAIIQGALLHDIGMLRIDEDTYIKPELSADDWQVMRAHPAVGEKIMSSLSSLHPWVKRVIAGHHAQPNGRGYGTDASFEAYLVGAVDTFTSMILVTPYRAEAKSPQDAWRAMHEDRGHFDDEALSLLKSLFVYPPLKKTG